MADPIKEYEANLLGENNTYDASDGDAINRARQKAARENALKLEVVRKGMQTEPGRKYFYDLLCECGVFTSPFRPGDPHTTSFLAGMQEIGHKIQADIMNAAPDLYMVMNKEGALARQGLTPAAE